MLDDPAPALIELFADPRRRLLLHYLLDRDEGVPLWELSRRIATAETPPPADGPDGNRILSVYVSLYRTHVPALEDAGVVEYDETERVVSLADRADESRSIWRAPCGPQCRRMVYYLTLALSLGTVLFARALQFVPIPEVGVSGATLGVTAALLWVAIAHYCKSRVSGFADSPLVDRIG